MLIVGGSKTSKIWDLVLCKTLAPEEVLAIFPFNIESNESLPKKLFYVSFCRDGGKWVGFEVICKVVDPVAQTVSST